MCVLVFKAFNVNKCLPDALVFVFGFHYQLIRFYNSEYELFIELQLFVGFGSEDLLMEFQLNVRVL